MSEPLNKEKKKTYNDKALFFYVPTFTLNMIWHPLQATCSQKQRDSSVHISNAEVKNDTEKTLTVNKLDVCQKTSWCLSINIDQSKVLALLFADWRAAQASTQDTQD